MCNIGSSCNKFSALEVLESLLGFIEIDRTSYCCLLFYVHCFYKIKEKKMVEYNKADELKKLAKKKKKIIARIRKKYITALI